jgi:signal transduction histidine kinase
MRWYEKQRFENELENIKISILKLLYSLVSLLSIVATILLIISILNGPKGFAYHFQNSVFYIALACSVIFPTIRLLLNKKNYKFAALFLVASFALISIVNALNTGTFAPIHIPILVMAVLLISIVFDVYKALLFTAFIFIAFMAVSYLHLNKIVSFIPDASGSEYTETIFLFITIGIIIKMADIAYGQIEHSYFKALKYSRELEKFNAVLDQQVKERTTAIVNNYKSQVENMHNTAMLGMITKPLLHDLATPLSTLIGGLDLIKDNTNTKIVAAMDSAVTQIQRMLEESRELMRGKHIVEIFHVAKTVERTTTMLQNECAKYDIRISINIEQDAKIKGSMSQFERIIINLAVNAIEELKNVPEDNRKLAFTIKRNNSEAIISVKDSGRGIPESLFNSIFSEEFSLKHSDHNFGLGLSFVKKVVTEQFEGSISVQSIVGEYTEFSIHIPTYNEKKKDTSPDR